MNKVSIEGYESCHFREPTSFPPPKDSRLAYIAGHLICAMRNLLTFGGIIWIAYLLKSGWVLWALALCPWCSYKHDFNAQSSATAGAAGAHQEEKR